MTGRMDDGLAAHLKLGLTTLCHAWAIRRRDGAELTFTDHDAPLSFDGVEFRPDRGLNVRSLSQTSGLSVNNTEAMGALSHSAIREDEIEQGRFDGAEVSCWRVNWADVAQRILIFRGTVGEIQRAGGVFRAELRGLTEALNRPMGRIYQKQCTAVLGDKACGFDVTTTGYSQLATVQTHKEGRVFRWDGLPGFDIGWFTRGRVEVIEGPAKGLWGTIKHDRIVDGQREIELWEPIRGAIEQGIGLQLSAGCDKRMTTCRLKFNNLLNFQGFPDIPNEDWMMATPMPSGANTGGSMR